MSTKPIAALGLLGALALPSAAPAATPVGTWNVGPLLDVKITKSAGVYTGRAVNRVSACGVSKGEAVWRFSGPSAVRLGTSEVAAFPGGVCYGFSALQASFQLVAPNTLRLCIPNDRRPGSAATIDVSSPPNGTSYPCADYSRKVKRKPPPVGAVGALEYYLRAYRSPATRCPSTGPQTYNVFFKDVPVDPMLRVDSVTINGTVPEVYEGNSTRGYVSVPTQIRRKYVTVVVRFTTESGRRLGIRVTWRPCA